MFASARLVQRILAPLAKTLDDTLPECAAFERPMRLHRAQLLVLASFAIFGVLCLTALRVGSRGVPEIFAVTLGIALGCLAVPVGFLATRSLNIAGHLFIGLVFALATGTIGLTGGAGLGGLMTLSLVPLAAGLLCGFRAACLGAVAGVACLGFTMHFVSQGVQFPVDPTSGLIGTGRLWLEFLFACATAGILFDWLTARALTELRMTDAARASEAERLAALARLGRRALSDTDTVAAFDSAGEVLRTTLGFEMAKVLEFDAEHRWLWLRAGVGWHAGLVGNAAVPSRASSQAGYTLAQNEPVVV